MRARRSRRATRLRARLRADQKSRRAALLIPRLADVYARARIRRPIRRGRAAAARRLSAAMCLRGCAAIYAGAEIALRVHFFRTRGGNVGAGVRCRGLRTCGRRGKRQSCRCEAGENCVTHVHPLVMNVGMQTPAQRAGSAPWILRKEYARTELSPARALL
jgi:hypothetical protein